MTPVNAHQSGLTYRMAENFFEAPARVQNWITRKTEAGGKQPNCIVRGMTGLTRDLFDYDYREFPRVALGKFSIPLAAPPKGALLLLLYPGTVLPRLYRAYQRGKENNDYREMGDVLRRDITAITLFVFALGPVVKALSWCTQSLSGVKLLDPSGNGVLKYSQFKNYEIDGPGALKAILTEGNGHALRAAVNGLHDRGLSAVSEHGEGFAAEIKKLKTAVSELVKDFDAHNPGQPKTLQWPTALDDGRVESIHQTFKALEDKREAVLAAARASGSGEMVKVAEKMKGEFTGVLQNYAKVRRLPADLISFGIMVGAIGYLPMWVNTEWNKRQFEKKMAAKAASELKKVHITPPAALQAPTFGLNPALQPQLVNRPQPFAPLPVTASPSPFNWSA